MEIFAWIFLLKNQTQTPDIDYDILQTGDKSYFIMGADESISSSADAIAFIEKEFWELETYDISIESEDSLEVISSEYESWDYECVSFEGTEVDFSDILERFADSMEAICVRECETSKTYGNKIVRVDFIYSYQIPVLSD